MTPVVTQVTQMWDRGFIRAQGINDVISWLHTAVIPSGRIFRKFSDRNYDLGTQFYWYNRGFGLEGTLKLISIPLLPWAGTISIIPGGSKHRNKPRGVVAVGLSPWRGEQLWVLYSHTLLENISEELDLSELHLFWITHPGLYWQLQQLSTSENTKTGNSAAALTEAEDAKGFLKEV